MLTLERGAIGIQMTRAFRKPEHPTEARAIGIVRGRLEFRNPGNLKGRMVTEDGTLLSCFLMPKFATWVKKNGSLEGVHTWTVYPQMQAIPEGKKGSRLFLRIKGQNQPDDNQQETPDVFSIRGVIVKQDEAEGIITIRIDRNLTEKQKALNLPHLGSFTLDVEGFLPRLAMGEFWDIEAIREGDRLLLDDASFVVKMEY